MKNQLGEARRADHGTAIRAFLRQLRLMSIKSSADSPDAFATGDRIGYLRSRT
jgi:hypothetical protein